jgi:hypothetical protein
MGAQLDHHIAVKLSRIDLEGLGEEGVMYATFRRCK